jgi:hypothetical protein
MSLREEIVNKYWFFKPDPTLQNNLMVFGLECGDGWLNLIDELCFKLDKLITGKYPEFKEDFQVLQVKEKYATLNFYVSSGNDEIFDLIDEYCDKSANICEECGKSPAKEINKNFWWYTRCEECSKKLLEEE